jgi:hypothetical protein
MTLGTAEPYSPPPVTEPPAKNSFQRIAGVLFAPAETFRDIARKPDILVPLILMLVIGIIGAVVLAPRMDFSAAMREQMERQGRQMSDSDLAQAEKMGGAIGRATTYASPILGIIVLVVIAGVLLLAFRLLGGEGNFKQAFSATLYAWMPMVINSIVMTAVVASRESINPTTMPTLVKSNPAFLVEMSDHPILFSLLSSLDIFTIWTLILLILGFAALAKVSKGKSAAIVISLWLVIVVVKLGFAALTAAGMKKT